MKNEFDLFGQADNIDSINHKVCRNGSTHNLETFTWLDGLGLHIFMILYNVGYQQSRKWLAWMRPHQLCSDVSIIQITSDALRWTLFEVYMYIPLKASTVAVRSILGMDILFILFFYLSIIFHLWWSYARSFVLYVCMYVLLWFTWAYSVCMHAPGYDIHCCNTIWPGKLCRTANFPGCYCHH